MSSASCLVTGPLAEPVSPFPALVCQHLTSTTQMGQFTRVLADRCLRFVPVEAQFVVILCAGFTFQKPRIPGYWEAPGGKAGRRLGEEALTAST